MKVAIVGAGAMGSLLGAMFAAAEHEVLLIEINDAVVDAINEKGITITRPDRTVERYYLEATADPSGLPPVNLGLIQVKGYATTEAAKLLRPIVNPDTTLMTMQNGLGNADSIRQVFPSNPVLVGLTVHSVTTLGPANHHHTAVRESYIGPLEETWFPIARDVVSGLEGSGYEFHLRHEEVIHKEILAKWIINCASNAALSLTGLSTEAARDHDLLMTLCDDVIREACGVARAEGYELDSEERIAYHRSLFVGDSGKASMLQDIEAGRRTEIDTLNGAAVSLAANHGLSVPLNRALHALVKGRESAMGISP